MAVSEDRFFFYIPQIPLVNVDHHFPSQNGHGSLGQRGMLWLTQEFWTPFAILRIAFQPCRWMEALRRSGGTPNQGCFLAILMALCKKNRMTEAEWTVQETAGWQDGGGP